MNCYNYYAYMRLCSYDKALQFHDQLPYIDKEGHAVIFDGDHNFVQAT